MLSIIKQIKGFAFFPGLLHIKQQKHILLSFRQIRELQVKFGLKIVSTATKKVIRHWKIWVNVSVWLALCSPSSALFPDQS